MSNRRVLVIVLLVGAVLILSLASFFYLRRPQEVIWTVQRGDLTASLEIPGKVIALRTLPVFAPYDSRVRILTVTAGDMVEVGDILAVLDEQPLRVKQQQAAQQLEQAELALYQAEVNRAPLETRLHAEQQHREAVAAFQMATERLSDKYIVSPQSGIVTEVLVSEGAPVAAGTLLLRLADTRALGISALLDEVDAHYVHPGQSVRISADALPGWQGDGTVLTIGQSASQQAGVVGFPLTVGLRAAPELLRPGMTATLHFDAVVRRDVLLIPEEAIRVVGERAYVTVVTGTQRETREVTLGLRSGGMVEVAAGLTEGEQIVLTPSR